MNVAKNILRFELNFITRVRAMILCALINSFVASGFAQSVALDKVLVAVNKGVITESEYAARHLREALQSPDQHEKFNGKVNKEILERMIDERIQSQIAARRGLQVSDQEVRRAIEYIAAQNNITAQQLLAKINSNDISTAQFAASIREQIIIRKLTERLVGPRVQVSDAEIENYLSQLGILDGGGSEYEISHIFVALKGREESAQTERENLEHIRQTIIDGRPFGDAARNFSDSNTREQDGYVGWRSANQLPLEFIAALEAMSVGEVSEVFSNANGLHLLRLHRLRRANNQVEQRKLRHILIRGKDRDKPEDVLARAQELRTRIINGEDFATIARIYSADRKSADRGGDLGWVNSGALPEDLEKQVSKLALKTTSEPLRSKSGLHLIQVLEKRNSDVKRERAANRARQEIFLRKANKFFEEWYAQVRDNSYVEYITADPS